MSISNRHIFGDLLEDRGGNGDFMAVAQVTAIDDPTDTGQITVAIKGITDKVNNYKVYPLLPKHINIIPKVGESVFIVKSNLGDDSYATGYYLGPLISQPHKIKKDEYFFTALNTTHDGYKSLLDVAPSNLVDAAGVYPKKEHIAVLGRDNTDVVQKNAEVLLRAGKHVMGNPLKFNKENPGYIQIKYSNHDEKTRSTVNVVADKINLLTHKGGGNYSLTDREHSITEAELDKIIEKAHPLPYGDVLVKFLKIMKTYMLSHAHPYHGLPPINDVALDKEFRDFNIDKINSENIKID